jgi:adenine deaminase
MGGGVALAQGGQVRARLPLGLGGICSLGSVEQTARGLERMHAALRELGCTLEYPLWTFVFLPFTSVLRLRITYQGVFDVREGRVIWAP